MMLPTDWLIIALTLIIILLVLCILIQGRRGRPGENVTEACEEIRDATHTVPDKETRTRTKILDAARTFPNGEAKTTILQAAGIRSSSDIRHLWNSLVDEGVLVPVPLRRQGASQGYMLAKEPKVESERSIESDKEAEAAVLSSSLRRIELQRMQRDIRIQSDDGTYAIYLKNRTLHRDTHHEAVALWQDIPEEERLPWQPESKPKHKPQSRSVTPKEIRAYSGGRAVEACDPATGDVVKSFRSLSGAIRAGYPSVHYAIANDKILYGFRWRDAVIESAPPINQPKPVTSEPVSQTNQARPVEGCDPITGRIVKRFPSVNSARLNGHMGLHEALRTGKQYKGLIWRDAQPSKPPETPSEKSSEKSESLQSMTSDQAEQIPYPANPADWGKKIAVGGSRQPIGPLERQFDSIKEATRALGVSYNHFYRKLDTIHTIAGLYWRRLGPSPCQDRKNTSLSNGDTSELDKMMEAWSELVGNEPVRVAQVIAAINEKTERGETPKLATILATRFGERNCVLGNWLRQYRDRIHKGRRFIRSDHAVPYWRLEIMHNPSTSSAIS